MCMSHPSTGRAEGQILRHHWQASLSQLVSRVQCEAVSLKIRCKCQKRPGVDFWSYTHTHTQEKTGKESKFQVYFISQRINHKIRYQEILLLMKLSVCTIK